MQTVFNPFVRRQTPESRFSHTTLSEDEVLALIAANCFKAKPGYRPGVVLVPVPAQGFFSATVKLEPGMALRATYEARRGARPPAWSWV